MFNVESEAELDAIARVAGGDGQGRADRAAGQPRRRPQDAPLHLDRQEGVEVRHGHRPRRSALAEAVAAIPSVSMIGMHMHIGSQITTIEPYAGAVAKGVEIIGRLREMGHPIAWYNMGGGFGIDYRGHEAQADRASSPRAIVPAMKADRLPAGDGAGAGDRRECRHPGQPCVIYQAVGREAVPDPGRRDERPDPAGALRVVPPDLAGRRPGRPARAARRLRGRDRGDRALGRGRPGLRERRLPGQGPRPAPRSTAATCWPSSRPGPTAWSWPPTTTPAPAPPRSSSTASSRGSSAAARPTRTCVRQERSGSERSSGPVTDPGRSPSPIGPHETPHDPRPQDASDLTHVYEPRVSPRPAGDRPGSARQGASPWLAGSAIVCASLALAWPGCRPGAGPGARARSRSPRSRGRPLELWDAVDYLVRTGQAEQAVPYLNKFLKSQPDDATLLDDPRPLRRRLDPAAGRLPGDPRATPSPWSTSWRRRRGGTRPGPSGSPGSSTALTKTPEEQEYAVERLREAARTPCPSWSRRSSGPGSRPEERIADRRQPGPARPLGRPRPDRGPRQPRPRARGRRGDGPRADRRPPGRPVPDLPGRARPSRPPAFATRPAAAIGRLTGRSVRRAAARSPVRVLTDEAWRYHLHAVEFPGDPVVVWTWDKDRKVPGAAAGAADRGRGALRPAAGPRGPELDPSDRAAQVALTSLALEKAVERVGLRRVPGRRRRPTRRRGRGGRAGGAGRGPPDGDRRRQDRPGRRRGRRRWGRSPTATRSADRRPAAPAGRGPVGPRPPASSSPPPGPWSSSAPTRPFAGSSRVVPILARFVTDQSPPRAVVIDGNPTRGSQLAGFLKALGYDPILASTGDEGFRAAAETADVELILIDHHLIQGAWRLTDTLANLRADARTAGIPIYVVGPLDLDVSSAEPADELPGRQVPGPAARPRPTLERQLGGPAGAALRRRAGRLRPRGGGAAGPDRLAAREPVRARPAPPPSRPWRSP